MPPWAALECDRTGWTLEMIPTDAPACGRAQGGPLAGEAGAYDEDVMLGHGRVILCKWLERRDRQRLRCERPATPCWSARRTWSQVTMPRSRPSASTAIRAPDPAQRLAAEQRLERVVRAHAQVVLVRRA